MSPLLPNDTWLELHLQLYGSCCSSSSLCTLSRRHDCRLLLIAYNDILLWVCLKDAYCHHDGCNIALHFNAWYDVNAY